MKTILIITRNKAVDFRQMPHNSNTTADGKYRFVINDYAADADFVVVISKGLRHPHSFHVASANTILTTEEPHQILAYARGYRRQFGLVCSCQPEIKGRNVIHGPAILPWYVGVDFKADGSVAFTKNYDDIAASHPEKTKLISVITSGKAFSQGHVDRLRFVRRLHERYGNQVDIYGHGFLSFKDKWEALAPYKYHIVIENSTADYYFTEKLADCYLAGAFPIYHGCRNVADYFPSGAMETIDIRDFDAAASTIDRVIASQRYEESRQLLEHCKELSLNRYNLFNEIAAACDRLDGDAKKEDVELLPASRFQSLHNLWLYTVGRNYYKFIARREGL